MGEKLVIGVDFGTLSARAALVRAQDGVCIAEAEHAYAHGVMDKSLPCGKPLPQDFALQHPMDYMEALEETIRAVMEKSGAAAEDVEGIGLDVTAATVLPVDAQGTPLCMKAEYVNEPHAYVKLWKHHGAQAQADRMTALAITSGEDFLPWYGSRISCELALPKLLETLEKAPQVYETMDCLMEMGDWLVRRLCGVHVQSLCAAGYKNLRRTDEGYPDDAYFAALNPAFAGVIEKKCSAPVMGVGSCAGGLTQEMAQRLGLMPGTPVATAMIDAHVCALSCGLTKPGQMLAILGTSACYMSLGEDGTLAPGICGVVKDGILPGCYGYEAGQSAVGDLFGWMTKGFVPEAYQQEADKQGVSIHQHLTNLAAQLAPGESGLLALDWLGGCRSPLMDSGVSGMILGLTLQTKPEEIYRSLIESTAYGARMIVENYRTHGIAVDEFFVTGGIGKKNPLVMQIFADVLGMDVKVIACTQGGAQGSAILAAAAAGMHEDLRTAIAAMASPVERVYTPDAAHHGTYDALYAEYCRLHAYFGRGENDVMKRLKAMKPEW
ncbi:MAG: ribulokinase [Clostridia bacterium]|nr:ribulokinase [Clostridia bacterium]